MVEGALPGYGFIDKLAEDTTRGGRGLRWEGKTSQRLGSYENNNNSGEVKNKEGEGGGEVSSCSCCSMREGEEKAQVPSISPSLLYHICTETRTEINTVITIIQ